MGNRVAHTTGNDEDETHWELKDAAPAEPEGTFFDTDTHLSTQHVAAASPHVKRSALLHTMQFTDLAEQSVICMAHSLKNQFVSTFSMLLNVDTQKCVASDLIGDQKHGHEMKGVSTQQLLRQCNNKGTVAVPWKLDKQKMTMFEKALSKAIGPWDLKSPYQWTTRSNWLSPSDAKLGATKHSIDTRRSRRIVDYLRLGRSNIAEMAIIASWPQSASSSTARSQLEAALHLMSFL